MGDESLVDDRAEKQRKMISQPLAGGLAGTGPGRAKDVAIEPGALHTLTMMVSDVRQGVSTINARLSAIERRLDGKGGDIKGSGRASPSDGKLGGS